MASGLPTPPKSDLINETEVRNYFIQNGGIVRNNDIVTYFRAYLANPVIRDEARAVFKSIVNKLATVKVENGEKYLVLKRQYFPPIDGNGNNENLMHGTPQQSQQLYQQGSSNPSYGKPVVLPPTGKTVQNQALDSRLAGQSLSQQQQSTYQPQPQLQFTQDYEYNQSNYNKYQQQSAPITSSNPYNFNPYTHQVPPPYISQPGANPNYLPQHQAQYYQAQQQQQSLSKSQPSLYGSNFSLISNNNSSILPPSYAGSIGASAANNNAYLTSQNYSQQQSSSPSAVLYSSSNDNYPPEYGLPTLPPSMTTSPPRRLSFSTPSGLPPLMHQQQPSFDKQGGGGNGRTPPPYRPPPPALAGSGTPPSVIPGGSPHGTRMMSPPSLPSGNPNYYRSPPHPPPTSLAFQSPRHSNVPIDPNSGQFSHQYQYQRSLSGPGNVTSPTSGVRANNSTSPTALNTSASGTGTAVAFLQAATNTASTPISGISNSLAEGVPAPPVPPRFKRGSSSSNSPNSEIHSHRTIATMNNDHDGASSSRDSAESSVERDIDMNNDKENANPFHARQRSSSLPNGSDFEDGAGGLSSSNSVNGNGISDDTSEETEQKISVKERMQKFNRIASESELGKLKNSNNINKGKPTVQEQDYDTASLSSYGYGYANTEPRAREWILKAATSDYHGLNKMALEIPSLVKRRDVNTALHWAAKHGNCDLIKLLAGTFRSDVHSKTNGGYTPLHLAAQFGRQEAYDLLIKVYNADPNIRDHGGKKPMQYLVRQDATVSMDTFKKIKEKRRSTESQRERDSSFLRIGSLNVRVKKTTEAFGNFLGKSNSSSSIERMMATKSWGSADNLQESFDNNLDIDKDKEMMPPPNGNVVLRGSGSSRSKHSRSRRSLQNNDHSSSSSISNHQGNSSDSEESDTACGFGSDWKTN